MPGQSYLRFFLSEEDQARVDPASIVVEDIPDAAAPEPNKPYPQSLWVSFRIMNPQAGSPVIRPLFPGQVTFSRDESQPGRLPAPWQVRFTEEDYKTWPTLGRLMIRAERQVITPLETRKAPEVIANTVWFSGVRASKRFLLHHLPQEHERESIAGTPTIRATSRDWPEHAVSRFLEGRYEPILWPDALAEPQPVELATVDMAADGLVSLVITTARLALEAFDGSGESFDTLANDIPSHDPVHPRFGVIPARHVYRAWRADMLDAKPGNVLADEVLAEWPQAPRYFPLRFTRIWRADKECSVLFPAQKVKVLYADGGTPPVERRLPNHGLFYLTQLPRTPEPPPPSVQVSIQGEMRWMKGEQAEAWKLKAGTAPLPISLTPGGEPPHIILRRPFTQEMLADTERPVPGGDWLCTYLSMRRTLRAFVDHRISGGNLNFKRAGTARTRRLINEAWKSMNAWRVAKDQPPINPATSDAGNTLLMEIIKLMFPDSAHAVAGCSPAPARKLLQGQVAYYLWQTATDTLNSEATKCYFGDELVGRGGAGAAVALGAAELLDNVMENEPVTTEAIRQRLMASLLDDRLQPGAIIQVWWVPAGFDKMRKRQTADFSERSGHSPVFAGYARDTTHRPVGIKVIDPHGEREYPVRGAICLAANWTE